jgi:leucyl aminopeptidase
MKVTFANPAIPEKGVAVVFVLHGRKLLASAKALDEKMDGGLTRAIKASRFKGAKGHTLTMLAPAGTKLDRVFVVGLGEPKQIDALAMQEVGGRIYAGLATKGHGAAVMLVDAVEKAALPAAEMATEMAYGALLASYRFDTYRTKIEDHEKATLTNLRVLCDGSAKARTAYRTREKVADGVFFTRDLVSEPANVLYPETFAQRAKTLAKLGVKVEVLGEKEMRKLGMGALLGVAQGSVREPKVVVMRWNGGPKKGKDAQPIAFVGKGVTFDTGGISIKPSAGMEDMKWDMGGAGVVTGLMKALAGRKAKVNVVGVVGMVENMPDGNAQRPGDIVKTMSGQTVEVLNTDAEGRLVLADALHYTIDRFKPRFVVDLATLTGAILVCLGTEMAGLFSNDDDLSGHLTAAGKKTGEEVWRLPLGDAYDKLLKSQVADIANISSGRWAGSITAAQFLQRFVGKTPWAHLDIAGVTWWKEGKPTVPKGGTAFGVRLLDTFVAENYEG